MKTKNAPSSRADSSNRWIGLVRLMLMNAVVAHAGEQYRVMAIDDDGMLTLKAMSPTNAHQNWVVDPLEVKLGVRHIG